MPKLILCRAPGCNQLSDQSFCPKHRDRPKQDWRSAKTAPFANAQRYNTELYQTQRWKELRQKVLDKFDHRCCKCGTQEHLQVHHIKRPFGDETLFFDENNLIPICDSCHRIETASQCKTGRK